MDFKARWLLLEVASRNFVNKSTIEIVTLPHKVTHLETPTMSYIRKWSDMNADAVIWQEESELLSRKPENAT
jgi:hypothetical protein